MCKSVDGKYRIYSKGSQSRNKNAKDNKEQGHHLIKTVSGQERMRNKTPEIARVSVQMAGKFIR